MTDDAGGETIDARGLRCPWPALRAARALRDPAVRVLTVLADDPNAAREVAAICGAQGAGFVELAPGRFRIAR